VVISWSRDGATGGGDAGRGASLAAMRSALGLVFTGGGAFAGFADFGFFENCVVVG